MHGISLSILGLFNINSAMYLQSDASIALLVSWLATSILNHSSAISSMSSISKLNFIMFLHFCAYSVKLDSMLHNIHSKLADEWIGRFSAIINISKDE